MAYTALTAEIRWKWYKILYFILYFPVLFAADVKECPWGPSVNVSLKKKSPHKSYPGSIKWVPEYLIVVEAHQIWFKLSLQTRHIDIVNRTKINSHDYLTQRTEQNQAPRFLLLSEFSEILHILCFSVLISVWFSGPTIPFTLPFSLLFTSIHLSCSSHPTPYVAIAFFSFFSTTCAEYVSRFALSRKLLTWSGVVRP